MGRFSPTVRPTDRDPFAEALNELRGSFGRSSRAAQGRLRQEELDDRYEDERDYDREQDRIRMERLDRIARLQQESRDYDRYGQPVSDEPITEPDPMAPAPDARLYDSGATGLMMDDLRAAREMGFERPAGEQEPPAPGSFVPGQGFQFRYLRTDPYVQQREGGRIDTGREPYAPGERVVSEQVGEGRHIDPRRTPEARTAAQQEMVRRRLLERDEVDAGEADLITAGVMDYGDAMPDRESSPRLQRFVGGDGFLYQFDPATGQTQPVVGPDGRPMRAPSDNGDIRPRIMEQAEGTAAAIALNLVGGDNPTMPDATRAYRYIADELEERYPGLKRGDIERIAIAAVDNRRETDLAFENRGSVIRNREGGGARDLLAGLLDEEPTSTEATARDRPRSRLPGGKPAAYAAEPPARSTVRSLHQQIDADLASGKSPDEILSMMSEAGVPTSLQAEAEAYLAEQRGGGGN